MRVVALCVLLAACTDESDPCAESADHCVALRVESSIAFDELELGITIGTSQSVVLRTTGAVDAPFVIPIEVAQPVELDIVAVGRAGQPAVAAGAITVEVSSTEPVLPLAAPQTCVEGGYYCGGDKLYGDPNILYTCRSNRVPELKERCETQCVVAAAGSDDYCMD